MKPFMSSSANSSHSPYRLGKKMGFALALGLLLAACSDSESAGGTASEGESFVYGYVQDSTMTTALLRSASMAEATSTQVVLSREVYTSQGLESQWSDTVTAAADGYFSIALPDSGLYTLTAMAPSGAATVYAEIYYQAQNQNLGKLGLFGLVTLQGSWTKAPACDGGLRLSMPGHPNYAQVEGDGSFSLGQVPTGRAILLAQCADTVQQWALRLPGSCSTVLLNGIPWNENSGAPGQAIAQGTGFNAAPGANWNWRQRETLVLDTDCQLQVSQTSNDGQQDGAQTGN